MQMKVQMKVRDFENMRVVESEPKLRNLGRNKKNNQREILKSRKKDYGKDRQKGRL